MSRVRFQDPAGSVRFGEWENDGVTFSGRLYDLDEVTILPPVEPTKIICIGLNYADHAEETDSNVPERPLLFLKAPNTLAGHNDTITLPQDKDRIDYEAELGVVIGQQCRNVSADRAEGVIEGYTCVNDLSNRDDQREEQNWVRGKSFDNSAPIGPVVVSPDQVPTDASIELRQNGGIKQASSIDNLIFPIPEIIEEITKMITLEPGDVIATGTPSGVSPIDDGDTIELELEGVGTLRNEFVAKEFTGDIEQDFGPPSVD